MSRKRRPADLQNTDLENADLEKNHLALVEFRNFYTELNSVLQSYVYAKKDFS